MSNNEKKLAADFLCMRTMKKAEDEENSIKFNTPKRDELEFDRLYHWILRQLEEQVDNRILVKTPVTILITGSMNEDGNVFLEYKKPGEYCPIYVDGKEFFDVIKNTLQFLDEMDNFHTIFYQKTKRSCEIWISMTAKR